MYNNRLVNSALEQVCEALFDFITLLNFPLKFFQLGLEEFRTLLLDTASAAREPGQLPLVRAFNAWQDYMLQHYRLQHLMSTH